MGPGRGSGYLWKVLGMADEQTMALVKLIHEQEGGDKMGLPQVTSPLVETLGTRCKLQALSTHVSDNGAQAHLCV